MISGRIIVGTAVAIVFLNLSCTHTPKTPARQWQEGAIIHYHDGYDRHDGVSIEFPYYHVEGGQYVASYENSSTHFHISRNPNGPPNQYIRCFATRRADGTWEHKPQWHENDLKYQMDYRSRR